MMVRWFSRPGGGSDLLDRYHAAQRDGRVPLHPSVEATREIFRKLRVKYKPRYKYVKFIPSAPLFDGGPERAGTTISVDPSRNFGAEMLLLAKPGVFLVSIPDYRRNPQEPQ